jgi:ABC-type amino acid transport substrate-binding protein
MLVINSKTSYFDNAQQRGATYDMGMEFEKWLNRSNKDRARPIRVVFIPTSRTRLMSDLAEGRGDIAAAGLSITPERQALVSFATPFADDVSEIVVTAGRCNGGNNNDQCREPREVVWRQARRRRYLI